MLPPYLAATEPSPWTSFAFTIIGILIGALAAHILTRDRDARTKRSILAREAEIRRREFARLVVRGCCRIQRPATPDHAPEDPWIAYNSALADISAECDGDFPANSRVARALSAAVTLEKQQVEDKVREEGASHRQVLCGFLSEIAAAATSETKESEQAGAPNP
ncbi:MAG: hypothetical protein KDN05_19410 [Verrucomicrobiae bacterium]|nr:hypothetical protein [Verrucomicrobiae bacterium]